MIAAAALACGGQEGTTEATEAGSSSGGAGSTGSTGSTGAEATTTGATSTGEGSSTTGDATTGPMCETAADACGVMVGDEGSMCVDPPPAQGELKIEVLGPGSIKVTEVGHDASCSVSIAPVVKIFAPNTISITYEIGGQPMDNCLCKFEITATLAGLAKGSWTVNVLPYSQMVDVP